MLKFAVSVLIGNVKESMISTVFAIAGTFASSVLGGWDMALKLLVFCLVADYVTGVLGAVRTRTLNSEVMFWGGLRKAIIIGVIAFSVLMDAMMGNSTPVFRMLALYFYIGREGLSIIENLGVLGVPLPAFVEKVFDQLRDKGSRDKQ